VDSVPAPETFGGSVVRTLEQPGYQFVKLLSRRRSWGPLPG